MKEIEFDERMQKTVAYYGLGDVVQYLLRELTRLTSHLLTREVVEHNQERRVAVQNFSDWHIGKKVVIEGKMIYDKNIAIKRAEQIFQKSLGIIERTKSKHVVVAINGDMVEGGGVNFLNQPYQIDGLLDEHMTIAATLLWKYISAAADIAEKVTVITVPGNHGNAKIPDPTANFDLITYRYLAHMIETHSTDRNNNSIDIWISKDKFINYSPYDGLRLHMRHMNRAKQIKTAAGRARFLSICDMHKVSAILSGHWHSFSCDEANGKWNIINGSLVGIDDYAESLSLFSPPSQALNIFEDSSMTEVYILTDRGKDKNDNQRGRG